MTETVNIPDVDIGLAAYAPHFFASVSVDSVPFILSAKSIAAIWRQYAQATVTAKQIYICEITSPCLPDIEIPMSVFKAWPRRFLEFLSPPESFGQSPHMRTRDKKTQAR